MCCYTNLFFRVRQHLHPTYRSAINPIMDTSCVMYWAMLQNNSFASQYVTPTYIDSSTFPLPCLVCFNVILQDILHMLRTCYFAIQICPSVLLQQVMHWEKLRICQRIYNPTSRNNDKHNPFPQHSYLHHWCVANACCTSMQRQYNKHKSVALNLCYEISHSYSPWWSTNGWDSTLYYAQYVQHSPSLQMREWDWLQTPGLNCVHASEELQHHRERCRTNT